MSHQDRVAAIERALRRLLLDPAERGALENGGDVGVPSALEADLRRPDRCPLSSLSEGIVDHVARRTNRGVGTLQQRFSEVFDAWEQRVPGAPNTLIAQFLASPQAEAWRPIGAAKGPGIEEAFADFAIAHGLGSPTAITRQMVLAVAKALTIDPNPRFTPPDVFRGEPGRWVAVLPGDPPELFAAVAGRLMTGPVTPMVARILHNPAAATTPAQRQTAAALRERGLLPEMSHPVQTIYKPVA